MSTLRVSITPPHDIPQAASGRNSIGYFHEKMPRLSNNKLVQLLMILSSANCSFKEKILREDCILAENNSKKHHVII
jgi:hypothetical protein